ncbi:MAG: hypothetical protein ACRDMV_25100 [Streptosporangiales bacterium]
MKIPAVSTEYVYSTITADHDITGDTAEVAAPLKAAAPSTWTSATVTGVADNGDGTWTATVRILLGSDGDMTLTAGTYDYWLRLTDTPEKPARNAGPIQVT